MHYILSAAHHQNPVVIEIPVAGSVNKTVFCAVFIDFKIGKIIKIKTFSQQFGAGGFGFSVREIELGKNTVIFPEAVVDVPHQVGGVLIQAVVVGVPAFIAAEFFIRTPDNFFSACKTVHGEIV